MVNVNSAPTWTGLHTFSNTATFNQNGSQILIQNTGGGLNVKNTLIRHTAGGTFSFYTATDAAPTTAVNPILQVGRTGTTVDSIALTSTALTWNGVQVATITSPTLTDTSLAGAIFETGILTPAQITADQNNYAPAGITTCSNVRLTSDTNGRHITGISAGGTSGRTIRLINANPSANSILFDLESASSTAANRFAGNTGSSISLSFGSAMTIWYDATSQRWVIEN